MLPIERYGRPYEGVLARYMLAEDDLAREATLFQATETGKALLVDNPSVDQILELHHRSQARLAARWQAADASAREHEAHDRLARGDAMPLMLALTLPHELAHRADMERRWQTANGKVAALFEQIGDFIAVLDAQGTLERLNPALRRATGWSVGDAASQLGLVWAEASAGLQLARTTQHLRLEHLRQDGSCFTAEWSISPIVDPDGQRLSHVCIGRDVTRQQQIEDGLRENDKLRAVATLAAGIAHDFNNLLGSMMGLAELCELEAAAGSRQARNLGRIRQAGGKAAELVRQLLDFSRQTPTNEQRMLVSELLAHAAGLLHAALPRHIALQVQVDADGPVRIDLVQMEQVLLNMTRNAAHAMRLAGGVVRLVADRADPAAAPRRCDRDPGHARLRVIDSGEGMAPALLGKIFEPFFTTKPVGEGTGLGLAAVHGVVTRHGGAVEVDSTPGVGTTFSVFLPLAADAGRLPAQVAAAAAEDEAAGAEGPLAVGLVRARRLNTRSTSSAPAAQEDTP